MAPEPGADPDAPDDPRVPTVVQDTASRTAITRNESPDVPFDRSINPYQGCEHGCVYCFARPDHAWHDLSPGLDFETRIFARPEAPDRLRAELRRPGYRCRPVAVGTHTDAYQPAERDRGITRAVLEVLREARHPLVVITKSALVLRDLDILAPMAAEGLAAAAVSVTTLDPELARDMEPRAAAPARRLEVIAALATVGVPVTVLASPMIPGLNDAELERILEAAAAAGARSANTTLLRLPRELKTLFADWLAERRPARAAKVLNALRDSRGGDLHAASFGVRMTGTGPVADLLAQRFRRACRSLELATGQPAYATLDVSRFRPPAADARQRLLL